MMLKAQGGALAHGGNVKNQGQRPGQPVGEREGGLDLGSHSLQAPQPASRSQPAQGPVSKEKSGAEGQVLPMITKCPSLP